MNTLRVHTQTAESEGTFLVHWTNSDIRLGGCLEIAVKRDIQDKHIVAELAGLRHLLEVRQVLGENLIGMPGTRLVVSCGAIRKLKLRQSGKAHLAPYATFLATRFAGCELKVSKDTGWFLGRIPEQVERITVREPAAETIRLAGVGEVAVTRHVLERLTERMTPNATPDESDRAAWKKLGKIASHPSLREVARDSLWAGILHGNREGRYFLSSAHNLVLVVTGRPGEGRRLVTAYPPTPRFRLKTSAVTCAGHRSMSRT